VNTTNVDYKELRKALGARYFVQWVTKLDSIQGHLQVVGYCVRDQHDPQWKTVFQHKDKTVCRKVCEMLNEGELTNVRGT
jgi:hypothetical protein